MAYLLGYISGLLIVSFLIVYFVINNVYAKKNGHKMSKGQIAGFTIGIGAVLLVIALIRKNL